MDLPQTLALFRAAVQELQNQHGYSAQAIQALLEGQHTIPAVAFSTPLTPFETLCRYLTDNGMSMHDISRTLHRSKAVVQRTLQHSYKKHDGTIPSQPATYVIPVALFADRKYTFSEHLYRYLAGTYKLNKSQIARLLNINPRTVWTVLHRAGKRGERT